VPQGRTRRFLHLGRAVGEMAASAAADGMGRLARGERPDLSQLMLTPANARRLAERLSTMRGAVMKVGQLMSMDGHGVLPPAFAELLGGLRDQAHTMPATQLADLLEREYGADWHGRFKRFSFQPIASASIGQVHRAETREGQVLALKIQFPGVRQSIASDVANLALLARTPGLVPRGLDVAPFLERVQEQLLRETDYAAEAAALMDYRARLGSDPVLWVPAVVQEHCTAHILATEFATGTPVADLAQHAGHAAPQAQRDHLALTLARLAVREFFEMRLVQSDPNFGNYLFDAATGRIALLDFGATEPVSVQRVEDLRALGRAQKSGDRERIHAAALAAGFIGDDDPPAQAAAVVDLMLQASEPLRHVGPYDFGGSTLVGRLFETGQEQFRGAGYARTPPTDLFFFQRKFAGTFLLCARLRARVDLALAFGGELDG
jgi:predicted unusual protein kinase regulating ubiquinone biosynthesis (AarF/ABC1/UbiB family)